MNMSRYLRRIRVEVTGAGRTIVKAPPLLAMVLDRSVQIIYIRHDGKAERVRSRCSRDAGNVRFLVERLRCYLDR